MGFTCYKFKMEGNSNAENTNVGHAHRAGQKIVRWTYIGVFCQWGEIGIIRKIFNEAKLKMNILGNPFKMKIRRSVIVIYWIHWNFIFTAIRRKTGFRGCFRILIMYHTTGSNFTHNRYPGGCNLTAAEVCGNSKVHTSQKDEESDGYGQKFLHLN